MRSAIRVTVATFGVLAGLAGIELILAAFGLLLLAIATGFAHEAQPQRGPCAGNERTPHPICTRNGNGAEPEGLTRQRGSVPKGSCADTERPRLGLRYH
jgi:hypothetical protein